MNFNRVSKVVAGLLLVGILAGCGSSSSSDAPAPAAPTPTTFTVSGTAATGAVFANATITIVGSDGTSYPATGSTAVVTAADGSYTITLPIAAKPPFVVNAARDDQTLVSVVAEAKDSTANVTPVTTLIASRLSSSGDPSKLADEIKAKTVTIDAAAVKAKVAEVVALIKPVMDAVGDSTDPLSGKIVANGTGADKVLDSLSITITRNSATSVNIEVAVKQKLAEGVQPTIVTFTNSTAPAATLPTVVAADLVPSGTADLISDLLKRMTACYALAQTDRIVANGTTAADVKATACKDMFAGNDPASYKNNGSTVGKTGAFSGIFGTGTGATFDRGTYEFTRGNGDLVISYRVTDSSGNVNYQNLVVKADTDGKLRAIGNQYKYNGGVNAYQQLRNFVAQSAADYYSTGYNMTVNATADVANVVKVVVTTPKGNTLLLKPSAGSSYFPLIKVNSTTSAETVTGTNFVRLAREYVDATNAGDPALADTSLFFSTDRYTAADILAIPAQAKWKFEYYLAGQTTPDATQYYTTRARAMTIAELKTQPLANVVAADLASAAAQIVSNATTTTAATAWWLPIDNSPTPVEASWEVPAGALAPTSIQVYGNYLNSNNTRSNFNDKIGVATSARSGAIPCSSNGGADTHCDSAGKYVLSDHLTGFHLWAQDAVGRDFAHFYAFYKVTLP